ncbi:hypothetical protein ANANG_G00228670 [Anguilla anguilla]|uniref:Uncharacterized protein n=1 Tax=Anguilla anguilla TaxID=7936 RepID=A0A9D3M1K3_ANGAN|nr:hypothetical protein ANANG_G00228670 [Anguilla anguilla]
MGAREERVFLNVTALACRCTTEASLRVHRDTHQLSSGLGNFKETGTGKGGKSAVSRCQVLPALMVCAATASPES